MSVEVTWYGHSATQVSSSMVKVLIDPFLTGNELAAAKPEDMNPDVIAVTHGHGDHLGDTVPVAKRTGALVVSNFDPASCREILELLGGPKP